MVQDPSSAEDEALPSEELRVWDRRVPAQGRAGTWCLLN